MSREKIIKLLEKENSLICDLLKFDRMIKGSFCTIKTKCGKPNCWCAEEGGHKHARLSWHENKRSRNKAIPENDHEWIKSMTGNNRSYKKLMDNLLKVQNEINVALENNCKKIALKTKKERAYLSIEK